MPPLICVAGPTASGKTALAVRLAKAFDGEVVSCDSMQLYKGMDIGTAKPAPEETDGIPHHMLSCADPSDPWSAGRYARAAREVIEDIRARGKLPLVCGGSGLYLRALLGGLADIPPSPRLDHGTGLYEKLRAADPLTAARLTPSDTHRITRALDVYAATGRTLSDWMRETPAPAYEAAILGLGYAVREVLYERIGRRTEAMLNAGLEDEVRRLLASGLTAQSPPLRAIGYREMTDCIEGRLPPGETAAAIAQSTRRYAKRQMTWFTHQHEITWFDPSNVNFYSACAKFVEISLSL